MYSISGNKVKISLELALMELQLLGDNLLDVLDMEMIKRIKLANLTQRAAVSEIMTAIKTDSGLYKTFQNTLSRNVNRIQSDMVARPMHDKIEHDPAKIKYLWVLGVAKHCPDCPRMAAMEAQTIKEWRSHGVGLPREGLTACSYYCKCNLVEIASG